MRLPDWCLFGDRAHRAAYAVDGTSRECITCLAHLEQARRWAGRNARVTPLQGHEPPPEQAALF
ncbi:hypothetical protein [Actinoplanes sp. NPDC051851]|uniref:hypothetical protein n=1 Tax=Actinoplanes sp. NPDC051851 TaxID=3154753 RepID=UPI003411FD18